jgi:transcriptional regulator with XRE-family HTH domain
MLLCGSDRVNIYAIYNRYAIMAGMKSVRDYMDRNKVSISKLCHKLEMQPNQMLSYLKGRYLPKLETLQRISDHIGVPVGMLAEEALQECKEAQSNVAPTIAAPGSRVPAFRCVDD